MPRRFTPTALFITGGLLIWLADFVFVYVFAAVACARGFADVLLANLRLVPLVVTSASVLAGVATVLLLSIARRRQRADGNPPARFIDFLVVATSVIALLALALLLLPLLLTDSCAAVTP